MKYLFGFGDSWPQGSELNPEDKTFIELLANDKSLAFKNFSLPSTSIPHLIIQFYRAMHYAQSLNIDTSKILGIFFLTSPDRDLIWKNSDQNVEMHLNPTHPEDKFWYKEIHTAQLVSYRVNTTMVALQSLCKFYNITDRYVWGWDTVDLWKEIDQSKVYHTPIVDYFLDEQSGLEKSPDVSIIEYLYTSKNRYIWPNSGHPNQLGHEKIAEILAHWIKI